MSTDKLYARIIHRDFVKRILCVYPSVDVTGFHGEESLKRMRDVLKDVFHTDWMPMSSDFPQWKDLTNQERNAWEADNHFEITTFLMEDDWIGPAFPPLEVIYATNDVNERSSEAHSVPMPEGGDL